MARLQLPEREPDDKTFTSLLAEHRRTITQLVEMVANLETDRNLTVQEKAKALGRMNRLERLYLEQVGATSTLFLLMRDVIEIDAQYGRIPRKLYRATLDYYTNPKHRHDMRQRVKKARQLEGTKLRAYTRGVKRIGEALKNVERQLDLDNHSPHDSRSEGKE